MATHIKQLIDEFLKQKQGRVLQQKTIEGVFNELLTNEVKQNIQLKAMTQDSIIISSNSSSVTYNLNLIKEKLLTEIKKQLPKIKKITVHTGAR